MKNRPLPDNLVDQICNVLNLKKVFSEESDINADVLLTHYNSQVAENKLAIVHANDEYYGADYVRGREYEEHRYGAHSTFYRAVIDGIGVRLGLVPAVTHKGNDNG
jgi:hypothetical protein